MMTRQGRTAAIIAAVLLLPGAPAAAQGMTCPPPTRVPVKVTLDYTPPGIDEHLSGADMNKLLGDNHPSKGHAIGLTMNRKSNFTLEVAFGTRAYPNAGVMCLDPSTIAYKLAYTPHIYVPFDLPVMGCERKTVIGHEWRHVNAFLHTARAHLPRIEAAINAALAAQKTAAPIPATQAAVDARKKEIAEGIMQAAEAARLAFYQAEADAQAEVDSPRSQERIQELLRCPGRPAASMLGAAQ